MPNPNLNDPRNWDFLLCMAAIGCIATVVAVAWLVAWLCKHLAWVP